MANLQPLPSLTDLLHDPAQATEVPAEQIPAFLDAPMQEQPEAMEVGSLEAEWRRWAEGERLEPGLVGQGLGYLGKGGA